MQKFDGFPDSQVAMVHLPEPFFSDLLPLIDDLAVLKVVLFCFWVLPQKEGRYRYLRHDDFTGNESLKTALSTIDPINSPEQTLQHALDKAVMQAILLCAKVNVGHDEKTLYFVNTARGRDAVEQIDTGKFTVDEQATTIEILPPRPTIYKLYEDNIGMLTPMIADDLKDMEQEFPAAWLEEALRSAVQANKRSIRYIRAILERWRTEGKETGENAEGHLEQDGERFIRGKYADFIDH